MLINKVLTLNPRKLILAIIASIFISFFVGSYVFAQSPTQSVSPSQSPTSGGGVIGLNFPVEDLGGCKDLEECTNYCEDPVNQNTCTDFAKKNGFYRDDQTAYGDDEFWEDAKEELGCDSHDSCFGLCSQPANYDTCESYAKRNEMPGGYVAQPDKPEFLEIAKDVLGCDSAETCSTFCDNSVNAEKCSDFANQVGLLGGNTREGPGGCQSGETCGAYCSDPNNFEECKGFAPDGNFSGPGGCSSESSCRSYCEQNPNECRAYAPGTNGVYVPIVCGQNEVHGPGGACTAIPEYKLAITCAESGGLWNGNTCIDDGPFPLGIDPDIASAHFEKRSDMGNCASPGECYDYCKDNLVNGASVCPGFDASTSRPTDDYTPYLYYTPGTVVKFEPKADMGGCTSPAGCYDYCKENPCKCEGFDSNSPEPVDIWIPNTYYTPPTDSIYTTPPTTNFYTTPIYYTPPVGSNYTTPQYYTPGTYSTPSYQTPPTGSNYVTPNYYSPWASYPTPRGEYPTPNYPTPRYYTHPGASGYTTPYYYTPPAYTTPFYYTPPDGSNYTTPPNYVTPPAYTSPSYYTPYTGANYSTPIYYTPPVYTTPTYYTPPEGSNYTSPSYYTPPPPYTSPSYYTPGRSE